MPNPLTSARNTEDLSSQRQRQRQVRSANLAYLLWPIFGLLCMCMNFRSPEFVTRQQDFIEQTFTLCYQRQLQIGTHLATSDLTDNRQLFKLSGCLSAIMYH